MRKSINPKTNQPYKILWYGDLITPSGFGRIGNEVTRRLHARGYQVNGASISYTGWPHDFPFWVWPLGNQDIWNGLVGIVNSEKPDLLVSCQDFPYHQQIWYGCKIDFSRVKWVYITPIDGTPIHPDWVKLCQYPDGKMVISRFGVEAMRQAGVKVDLCHPGADAGEFYPATPEERAELRRKASYSVDDWIVGVVCMNQGRKAISAMLEAFFEVARDKPRARIYLDMDKTSPAGWDIPALLKQMSADPERVRYREDLFKLDQPAFAPLRNRYALMDAHMVISHREGFGLPLLESMACHIPTLALDYCSGTEVVGEGRGYLVKRIDYMEHGTWGGARDVFPDMRDLVAKLNAVYDNPAQAAGIAQAGYEWATKQTWDVCADQVEDTIQRALQRERSIAPHEPVATVTHPTPGLSDQHGPSYDPTRSAAPGPVSNRTELQEPARPNAVPQEPVRDSAGAGPDGQVRDTVPG